MLPSVGSPDMVDHFLGDFVILSCELILFGVLSAEARGWAWPSESLCFLQPGYHGNLPSGFLLSVTEMFCGFLNQVGSLHLNPKFK